MPKINYYDGKKYVQYEVSDAVADVYAEISQEEKCECWRKRKRPKEKSLDEMSEHGNEPVDSRNILQEYIESEMTDLLLRAINILPRSHRELIKKIYFDGFTQAEVARLEGVSRAAIKNRLNLVFAELKKLMGSFVM